jgi:hypothetical protein
MAFLGPLLMGAMRFLPSIISGVSTAFSVGKKVVGGINSAVGKAKAVKDAGTAVGKVAKFLAPKTVSRIENKVLNKPMMTQQGEVKNLGQVLGGPSGGLNRVPEVKNDVLSLLANAQAKLENDEMAQNRNKSITPDITPVMTRPQGLILNRTKNI